MRLPRSQTTIWKILRLFGCIAQEHHRKPKPLERKHPGEEVQLDLKDATSVPADPEGKRQHVVEITNFVDAGTSIWLSRSVGGDFDAESLLEVVAQFLRERGLPAMLTFDNDPRFVGSASGRDFPSALVRMLLCVGVEPNVCPPHRPDKNDLAAYCTPCARLACVLIFVSILLRSMFIGRFKDSHPMIIGPIHGKQTCPSPVHEGLSAHSIGFSGLIGG